MTKLQLQKKIEELQLRFEYHISKPYVPEQYSIMWELGYLTGLDEMLKLPYPLPVEYLQYISDELDFMSGLLDDMDKCASEVDKLRGNRK